MAQVRDAGADAWLGKEAPEDSDLDVPEGEEALMALPAATNAESAPAGTSAQRDDPRNPLGFGARNKHRASYQSHGNGDEVVSRTMAPCFCGWSQNSNAHRKRSRCQM